MEEGSLVHRQHLEMKGFNSLKQGPPSRDRVSAAIALVRARQAARSRNGKSNENSPQASPVAKKDCAVTFASPVVTEMNVGNESPRGKEPNSTGALRDRPRVSPRSRKHPLPPSSKSNQSPRLGNTDLVETPPKEKVYLSGIDSKGKAAYIPDETSKESNNLRIVSTYEVGIHDTTSPTQTRSPLSPKSSNRHFFPPDNEFQDIDHPEGDLIPFPTSNKGSDPPDGDVKQHIKPLSVATSAISNLHSPKSPNKLRSPLSPKSRFRFLRVGKEAMNSSSPKDSTSKSQQNVNVVSDSLEESSGHQSEVSRTMATDQLNNQENSPIDDHLLGKSRQIDPSSRANLNAEMSSQICLHTSKSSSDIIYDEVRDSKDSEEISVDSQTLKDVGTFIDAIHNKKSSSPQDVSYHPVADAKNQEVNHLSQYASVGSSDSESGPSIPPATLADIGAYIDAVVKHKEFPTRSMSSDESDEVPDKTKNEIGAFIDALHHKCREVREPNEITYVSSSDDSLLLNDGRTLENMYLENEVQSNALRLEDEVLQLLDEVLGDGEISPLSKTNASYDPKPALARVSSPAIGMAGEGFISLKEESTHIHTDLEISSGLNNHISNLDEIKSLDANEESLISRKMLSTEESDPKNLKELKAIEATQNVLDNEKSDNLDTASLVYISTNTSRVSTTSDFVLLESEEFFDESLKSQAVEGNPEVSKPLATALPTVDQLSSETHEILDSNLEEHGIENERGTIEKLVNPTLSLKPSEMLNMNYFKDNISSKTHEVVVSTLGNYENEKSMGTLEALFHTTAANNHIDDTGDVFSVPEVEKLIENETTMLEISTNLAMSRDLLPLTEEPFGDQLNVYDTDRNSLRADETLGSDLTSKPHNQNDSSGWNLIEFFEDNTELENNDVQAQSTLNEDIEVINKDTEVNDVEAESYSFLPDNVKVQRESLAAHNYQYHGHDEINVEAVATHSVEALEESFSPMQPNVNTTVLDALQDARIAGHDVVEGDDLASASFEVDASDLIDTFLAGSVAHSTSIVHLNHHQKNLGQNGEQAGISGDGARISLNSKLSETLLLEDMKDEAQAVRSFLSRISPILSCNMAPLMKEAHIGSEAARVGLSKEATDAILTHVMGLNTRISDLHTADSFELDQILDDERFKCIEEVDQSENIAAFLSRMKALEAGGHFSEIQCHDIAADEAVEVDFELGFIKRTLKDGVNDEGPWWNEDREQDEGIQGTSMRKDNLGSDFEKADFTSQNPGSPQKSGLPRSPVRKRPVDTEVLKLQNQKAQLSSKQSLELANSYILHSLSVEDLPHSLSVTKAPSLMEEIERKFEEKERKLILSNNIKQSKWISPWEKRWVSQDRGLRESCYVVGKFQSSRAPRLDVFASVTKLSQWTTCPDRHVRRVPVSQHWRMAYKERTRNHTGFADIDVFSLYEASIVVAENHQFDDEPWEYRNVKQRFLHEKSISLSRNWFGTLLRKRGNDRYREPVSIPKSMEMPMENLPGEGEWLQEWYTTWQQRLVDSKAGKSQPDDESESDSYDSDDSETCNTYTVYTEGDDATGYDDDTATYSRSVYTGVSGSVFTSKRSQYSKFSRRSSRGGGVEDSWDDPPECGTLQNVKQRIGERLSLVHYQHLSCLSQSRWRKRYFPRGTFPYK